MSLFLSIWLRFDDFVPRLAELLQSISIPYTRHFDAHTFPLDESSLDSSARSQACHDPITAPSVPFPSLRP